MSSRKHRELMALTFSAALGMVAMSGIVSQMGFAQEPAPPKAPTNPNVPPGAPGTGEKPPRAPQDPSSGHSIAPDGSEVLTEALAENTMHLYSGDDFGGVESELTAVNTTFTAGAMNEIPSGIKDGLTSVRWNLAPGVVVVFYEDGAGKGEQLVIWGKGEAAEVSIWDFNDKASRWAWYDVGGGVGTSRSEAARMPPNGSKLLDTALARDTIQMFKNKDFKGDLHQVSPLSAQTAGGLHDIPSNIDDSLTSIRWDLPEGVVVTLYEDADGKRDRVSVWGKGQLADLDLWDFNDKVSRWSWAYVGAPATP